MRLIKSFLSVFIIILSANNRLYAEEWFDPTDYNKKIQINVSLLSVYPTGKLNDIYNSGYGMEADISQAPVYMQNYRISFKTGFIKLNSKEDTDDGLKTGIGNSYLIPFLLSFEYRQKIFRIFQITPVLTGGFSLNKTEYLDRSDTLTDGAPTGNPAKKTERTSLEPLTTAGMGIHYILSTSDSIFIRGEWCTIIETGDPMFFIKASLGYEKRF